MSYPKMNIRQRKRILLEQADKIDYKAMNTNNIKQKQALTYKAIEKRKEAENLLKKELLGL